MALRNRERITCLIPATMQVDGRSLDGAICDLSLDGCGFAFTVKDESFEITKGTDAVLSVQSHGCKAR